MILLHLQMPRPNGIGALRRIKAELPETRVVMLTMPAQLLPQPVLFPMLAIRPSRVFVNSEV